MKTLYLDCAMGAAGDMLTAALLELMPDPAAAVKKLNELNIPGVVYTKGFALICRSRCTCVVARCSSYHSREVEKKHLSARQKDAQRCARGV